MKPPRTVHDTIPETTLTNPAAAQPNRPNRWLQLWLGVLCMALIANLQYGWTLFVAPMRHDRGWSSGDIQLAFSLFIATETWLTPFAGAMVDRVGPRKGPFIAIAGGGVLVGLGWAVNAYADALAWLYAGAAISGAGGAAIYATCVGNAVKWFPDRRGLAVGLTAAGFGAGAALTVIPIKLTIDSAGYQNAFLWFGIGQAVVLVAISGVLTGPNVPAGRGAPPRVGDSSRQMLRSPIFWLLYVMFVCVSASGLMATAQLGPIARDWGIADTKLWFGASTLTVALLVDNVLNGLARPFFGAVSDRIGREPAMAIAFSLGAVSYGMLAVVPHAPWSFVACAGMIFFTWGEIFSLFPSTCTDTFGARNASANASLLYTAKGTSAFLVPLADLLNAATGGWQSVFLLAAAANVLVVILALLVLRPMRRRRLARAIG